MQKTFCLIKNVHRVITLMILMMCIYFNCCIIWFWFLFCNSNFSFSLLQWNNIMEIEYQFCFYKYQIDRQFHSFGPCSFSNYFSMHCNNSNISIKRFILKGKIIFCFFFSFFVSIFINLIRLMNVNHILDIFKWLQKYLFGFTHFFHFFFKFYFYCCVRWRDV